MAMEESKRIDILRDTFTEWMKENRANTDEVYNGPWLLTTEEVKRQLESIVSCKGDEVAALLHDNHYRMRFVEDCVVWIVYLKEEEEE